MSGKVRKVVHGTGPINKRSCIVFALIARPRSGKTFNQVQYIEQMAKAGRRVLVIDPDMSERAWRKFKRYQDIKDVPVHFKGVAVVPFSASDNLGTPTFPHIRKMLDPTKNNGRPGAWVGTALVMDDANVYAKGQVEDDMQWLFARKRQQGCDIILTGHSFKRIPPYFYDYIDVFCIGPCHGQPKARATYFEPDALKRMEVIREYVNALKEKNPSTYPWVLVTVDGLPFTGVI